MSTEVVTWEDRLKADAQAVTARYEPAVGRISLRAGQMSYDGNPIAGNVMQCVVVAAAFENLFYGRPFDPDDKAPPACFALSASGLNMEPHANVPNPISPACDTCSHLQFGSDTSRPGAKGKACKEKVRLALLAADAVNDPVAVRQGSIALLTIPVTSVKNWSNYVKSLGALYQRPPYAVLTEIKVTPSKNQFTIFFAAKGLITDTAIGGAIVARIADCETLLLQPYSYEEQPAAEPVAKKKKY